MLSTKKNFIDELYPSGSIHALTHPRTKQIETAVIDRLVIFEGRTVGVIAKYESGCYFHFTWLDLNKLCLANGEGSPME